MKEKYKIGIVGFGVMGRGLAFTFESKGFSVVAYDRNFAQMEDFIKTKGEGKKIKVAKTIEKLANCLERPRKILIMVPAGKAVDSIISELLPFLEKGDVLLDGGNSFFKETIKREKELREKGFYFFGLGISGGEEGALKGASIMVGGPFQAWKYIKTPLTAIAAKAFDSSPCAEYLGNDGAGHYVKMVHNAIEYALLQLVSEAYHLLKEVLNFSNEEISHVFKKWGKGELDSYLFKITEIILKKKDKETGKYLIDLILDVAEQKGTGRWISQNSIELGVPAFNFSTAVFFRYISSYKQEREKANKLLFGPKIKKINDKEGFIKALYHALYASEICVFAQGFFLLRSASKEYNWNLDLKNVVRIWQGGCIIRVGFLEKIKLSFAKNPQLQNLLLDEYFRQKLKKIQRNWRKIIISATSNGIPSSGFSSALAYYDSFRCQRLPANLIQAQRDFFGVHGYRRIDKKGFFHTKWENNF